MNTRVRFFILAAILILTWNGYAGGSGLGLIRETPVSQGYDVLTVESEALKNNKLNDAALPTLHIYLPPSYFRSTKKYPVVYFLPGFGDDPGAQFIKRFKTVLDTEFAQKEHEEFMVIGIVGKNSLGGSFYVNSEATGNWEDFIIRETIPFIERKYRVIDTKNGRGLFGFSMGGYGVLNIGMKHPELFQCIFSLSPGLFNKNGLEKAMKTWDAPFLNAYGAAFSPNLQLPPPYADIPKFDGTVADRAIVAKWETGFGDIQQKIADYLKKQNKIKVIHIEYGVNDEYAWIPEGCKYMSTLLRQAGIRHEIASFSGSHMISMGVVKTSLLPFFKKNLKFD